MEYWNGVGGRSWVELHTVLEGVLAPFTDVILADCRPERVHRVLDVGCGAGSTTLAAARRLGAQGACVGIDISEPLIAVARSAAERESSPAQFILADAQTYAFEPASFDLVISRFGVLFFEDSVRAFTNLRRAVRAAGRLRFVAWRSPAENPFFTTAEQAAARFIPSLAASLKDEPARYAFSDPRQTEQILTESGWTGIEIQPLDITCTLPERDLIRYVTRLGSIGRVFHEVDENTRVKVNEAVRAAMDPYVRGADVRFPAACWLVNARR